jgi:hypothetical protein
MLKSYQASQDFKSEKRSFKSSLDSRNSGRSGRSARELFLCGASAVALLAAVSTGDRVDAATARAEQYAQKLTSDFTIDFDAKPISYFKMVQAAPPPPPPPPVVGGTIINPVTGATLTIIEVYDNGVLATGGVLILTTTSVGSTLPNPNIDATYPDATVEIASVVLDPTTGLAVSVTFVDGRVVSVVTQSTISPVGVPTPVNLPVGAGDIGFQSDIRASTGGSGGRSGALFVSAGNGGQGSPGADFTFTVDATNPNVTTVSDGLPGIIAASIGGNGGSGGTGYLGASGGRGGAGGTGGDVTLITSVGQISTGGDFAHGVVAQSRSGTGGRGGSGILAGAGNAGAGSDGGAATVRNSSTIQTVGVGSIGVFAQSLGGGAGAGGGSYGLFGSAGDGDSGGNGGLAFAWNEGDVRTTGNSAYGVSAQSIGGMGGNSGSAFGLVTFTSTAAPGGNGGRAIIHARNGSSVTTEGDAAHGLFAQSIGGGGGNGGFSSGLVSLGADGGAGGNGGQTEIYVQDNAFVTTTGVSAHGVFAQSVGGGGGNSGVTAGAFSFGGDGSGGGTGGVVIVESGGIISTDGLDSRGIFAQSVGGGGGTALGTGGIASFGGSGGAGGLSSDVSVSTAATSRITTLVRGSDGIFAQSVGGGGGAGSTAGGVFAMGGTGGNGGRGGNVTVINGGIISTAGAYARGIFAQSVGGGGGSGGDAGGLVAVGGGGGGGGGVVGDVSIGGNGLALLNATGGLNDNTGGAVTVTNLGLISTLGNMASAIQAQSIGGGGGDGGATGGVFVTIGGDAGAGGNAGVVTINNYNNLSTGFIDTNGDVLSGHDSHGIFAQSVGGGGGNGGSSTSVSLFAGLAIGGQGGAAGNGGEVNVNFFDREIIVGGASEFAPALIQTAGDRARGVFAQSVGGGGGSGGFASQTSIGVGGAVSVAIGGDGAGGGVGGVVNVNGNAAIHTVGDSSEGMLLQSVGGGGGSGGFSSAVAVSASPGPSVSLSVSIGGSGGGGGKGGEVNVNAGGSIVTEGEFSTGFQAQSVGGGGGSGGFSISAAAAVGTVGVAIGVGVGGTGGDGGEGGVVNAVFNGTIATRNSDALGAIIQSVGGGGGTGGYNVTGVIGAGVGTGVGVGVGVGGSGGKGGNGGTVTGGIGGFVHTVGARSTGVLIQSVGGGGGNGGYNITGSIGAGGGAAGAVAVGVGGSGEFGGRGGDVTASASSIFTEGDLAGGFLAQSVGGGGGNGAMNVSGTIAASGGAAGGVSVGLGGSGGGGGVGGDVAATVTGDVTTLGLNSNAIVAQSVGGGGGGGGLNVSGNITASTGASGSIGVGLGGSGGGAGDAGEVSLIVDGTTRTGGQNSLAIVAQSVGGGGGSGGTNINASLTASAAGAGSIGVGLGGSGGTGGDGGIATLSVNRLIADDDNTLLAVSTVGDNASAIVSQSVGGGGGSGAVNITAGLTAGVAGAGSIGVGIGGAGGNGGSSFIAATPDAVMASAYVNGDVVTAGDNASAVFVQSLGGGGGNGGLNVSGGVVGSTGAAGSIQVGVGGLGGDGGNAGRVEGHVQSDIRTGTTDTGEVDGVVLTGHGSSAITFQSLGGGGGNGGVNISGGLTASTGSSGTIGVGIGGFGGDGGFSSVVDASFEGTILTFGNQAHGLLLQSLGGGGGNGGMNVSGAVNLSTGASGSLGFGLGGFGGSGGHSGDVFGYLDGDVVTYGDESFGAVLQSLGGGGGNGGLNVAGALAASSGGGSGSLGIGIGGFGGDGGTSGDVWATVLGTYVTHGSNAGGVLAQSQSGGGGNGGVNVSGSMTLTTGSGGSGNVGIGGFGGTAASQAGDVHLTRTGDTWTFGANSDGVTAQSVGGGGGNGGINVSGGVSATQGSGASLGFGLGGFGGAGGAAGDVYANIQGNVIARGLSSDITYEDVYVEIDGLARIQVQEAGRVRLGGSNGVVVQSLGGGGGNGGMNITGQLAVSGDNARAVSLGLGGFGGAGGDAGEAHLTLGTATDQFRVEGIGDERSAIFVQSLGGGGGNGGINISGGVSTNGNLVAGIGGFGADGGLGQAVSVFANANLYAAGRRSRGLIAQSIGGGGGAGGINISGGINTAGTVNSGNDSSLVFGLGGFGGDGNRSGNVDVTHNGDVFVEGESSVGVLVQSVAGGGGAGGLNVSGNFALGSSEGYAVSVGIGGFAGDGAHAGDANLNSTGNVIVRNQVELAPGETSPTQQLGGTTGILVQSIGGGGGQGGINATGVYSDSGNPIGVGVGGNGGSGGNGGNVTVSRGYDVARTATTGPSGEHFGVIQTFGDDSFGLIAQSVGGGGGDAGMNFSFIASRTGGESSKAANITIGGSGAGAGSGADVSVDHYGWIQTSGQDSVGMLAQSIGGGGGNANYNLGLGYLDDDAKAFTFDMGGAAGAAGSGGSVFVNHDGTIITQGEDSTGLLAQSIGGGGGNAAFDLVEALEDVGFEEYLGGGAADTMDVSIGRRGGSGGTGGNVDVIADGLIVTAGQRSSGIMAQSIGGGGGNSGTTSIGLATSEGEDDDERAYEFNMAWGLEGGVGAFSGDVTIASSSDIFTAGNLSHGIHAQSVGGGGGGGGSTGNFRGQQSGSVALGWGGIGGSGNDSGTITISSAGHIQTAGDGSNGIFAQSIGGGGGSGGNARTFSNQHGGAADNGSTTLTLNVGGAGANGSSGNIVDVTNTGSIITLGRDSHGILAQSIGGGGGNGGMIMNGVLQGSGDSTSATFNVGGSGAVGGPSRAVTVLNEGLIYTTGEGSTGISAQSIGGGGGNAGLIMDGAIGGSSSATTRSLNMNIGGNGGAGGTSGDVTVINRSTGSVDSGRIFTSGDGAYGIFAQSLSGGGGNGSSILAISALAGSSSSTTLGLNVGGQGGAASTAGNVHVVNDGIIETTGAGAHGIFAQSTAGGGGNGGLVLSAAGVIGAGASGAAVVSVGGQGGDGGDAGTVTVDNTGTIITRGVRAHGILAQSVGGGGGNAQLAVGGGTNGVAHLASGALNGLLGMVNSSDGGAGGLVTVNHTGNITVLGDGSQAIKVESINGGGGSITFEIGDAIASIPTPTLPFMAPLTSNISETRLGAQSVSDMISGAVSVRTAGDLGAAGNNGAGSVAQSIGGGGGTADLVFQFVSDPSGTKATPGGINVVLGGVDGTNNGAADLFTEHTGSILTNGDNSMGVLLQAIGGGGGRVNLAIDAAPGAALGPLGVALGGTNGDDETGGDVTRIQAGEIATTGAFAPAAMLQSIGGGGGSAAVMLVGEEADFGPVTTALGSIGGITLDGGNIDGQFSGGLTALGDHSTGLLVQSIGAGGGEVRVSGAPQQEITLGGSDGASGDGGSLDIINDGAITTTGTGSHGVVLQSIGGGGGAVFTSTQASSFSLSDQNSGDGDSITYRQTGHVTVAGDSSFGIIAQSLGGGGGWIDNLFAGTAGGAGGGGSVELLVDGNVIATGIDSTAVFAQSVGRDGGDDITIALNGSIRGGSGFAHGLVVDGGAANLINLTGSLSAVSLQAIEATFGDDRVINAGLVVGNIDLGSGVNSFNNMVGATFIAHETIDLRDATPQRPLSGKDSNRVVMDTLSPAASGDKPSALVMDVQASSSQNASETHSATPQVVDGGAEAAQPLVPIMNVFGPVGSDASAALAADTVANNSAETTSAAAMVTTSTSMNAASSKPVVPVMDALSTSSDDPTVASSEADGTGTGNEALETASKPAAPVMAVLDLGDSSQGDQPSGATPVMRGLDAGKLSALAGDVTLMPTAPVLPATFTNEGHFLMGLSASTIPIDLLDPTAEYGNLDDLGDPKFNLYHGLRVINEVALDGNFVQTDTGHLAFDVAFGPFASDHVTTTGDVTLDGTGDVTLVWLSDSVPVELFSGPGTAIDNGLDITDTLAVDYSIETSGGNALLAIETDFGSINGLNQNEMALGGHMDSSLLVGGANGTGRLLALMGNLQDEDVYKNIMTELNPEPHIVPLQGLISTSHSFGDDLMSCGTVSSAIDEGECFWSKAESSSADRDSSFDRFGTQADSVSVRGGYQQAIDDNWHLGVGIGIESIDYRSIDQARAHTSGSGVTVGVALKRGIGDAGLVAGSISGGWMDYETQRQVNVFQPGIAESTPSAGYLEGRLRASWLFEANHFYMMPRADMAAVTLRHDGFAETGIGGIGVASDGDTQTMFSVSPAIEFGWSFDDGMGSRTRASLALGARLYSEDSVGLPISFVQAPAGAQAALIATGIDQELYSAELGFEVIDSERINFELGYRAEYGQTTENHQVGLKLGFRF